MSRFLFLSLPLTGHVYPISAVAAEVARRGHQVAWAGSESFLRPLLGPDAAVFPIRLRLHRGLVDHGMAAARSRWDGYIVPHAGYSLPPVDEAVRAFQPDVLVVDQHAVAGALVAHRHRLPWATVAPTSMELTRPYRALPNVEAWVLGRLAALWTAAGLPGEPPHDLRFSPHLVIGFTSRALLGAADLPPNVVLVGAVLGERLDSAAMPPLGPDTRRRVLVTMGSLAMDVGKDFYQRAVEALRPLGQSLSVLVVAPDGTIADPPEHVRVVSRVPMLELLPALHAVVSHGGLNTVCEALAHGVPLVVAPIKGDQPVNAAQVAAAGAGIRVSFPRVTADQLRAAVCSVLADPRYRNGAEAVRDSFAAAGGAAAAAVHLQRLAERATQNPSTAVADPRSMGLACSPPDVGSELPR